MAKEYPKSSFYGFDNHESSITIARNRAREAGMSENIHFDVKTAKNYTEKEFDLICFMDCLHDMGDPVGAAKKAKQSLKQDGSILLVEPTAQDTLKNNINPISRLYYAASTAVCIPCSLSQEVGLALGA